MAGRFDPAGPADWSDLGDMLVFIGLSLMANSIYLRITYILTILVFMGSDLAEETGLEGQYGQEYISYKRGTPWFL